jgi:hypothetical protein
VKLVKGIIESVESRINAPYFGYLFCSLLAINWEALFYLFLAKKERRPIRQPRKDTRAIP